MSTIPADKGPVAPGDNGSPPGDGASLPHVGRSSPEERRAAPQTAGPSPSLVLRSVTFHYPGKPPILPGIDLELRPGELLGLIGPSGSGKSTLLSLLGGHITPTGGKIQARGVERRVWVTQNPLGPARRTALEQLALPQLAAGRRRSEVEKSAHSLLSRFDLEHVAHSEFRHLSGGEAQRVSLARAIAADPDLLLADEPTAQLDPRTARTIRRIVRELVSPHRLVVLATHDMALAEQCDRVIDLGAADARA